MGTSFLIIANMNSSILSVISIYSPVDAGTEIGRRVHKDKKNPVDLK